MYDPMLVCNGCCTETRHHYLRMGASKQKSYAFCGAIPSVAKTKGGDPISLQTQIWACKTCGLERRWGNNPVMPQD